MNYLDKDGDNYIVEIVLTEATVNGWVLFYYGSKREHVFQNTVFLKSPEKEDAVEEVYEFLGAGDNEDKRHEVLAKMTVFPYKDQEDVKISLDEVS